MQTRELYRQRARECVRMARKVSPSKRDAFLQIARAWRMLAEIAEPDKPKPTIH
jgi:hypothetical protein